MRSVKYLKDVKEKHLLENNSRLAEHLGIKANTVSQYLSEQRIMDNEVCLRVAAALDMDNPLQVIMAADMDRAEKAGQHSLWEIFLPKMAGVSALLAIAFVTNFVTPSPAQ